MQRHIQVFRRVVYRAASPRTVGLLRSCLVSPHHQVALREEACLFVAKQPVLGDLAHVVV